MDGCLHWLTDHKLMTGGIHCQGQPGCHTTVGAYLLQPGSGEAGLSLQTEFVVIALSPVDGWMDNLLAVT